MPRLIALYECVYCFLRDEDLDRCIAHERTHLVTTNDVHTDTDDLDEQIMPSASQMTVIETPIFNPPIDYCKPVIELKQCTEEESDSIITIEEQEDSTVQKEQNGKEKPVLRKPHKTFEYRLACVRYYETHGLTLTQSALNLGLRSKFKQIGKSA